MIDNNKNSTSKLNNLSKEMLHNSNNMDTYNKSKSKSRSKSRSRTNPKTVIAT